MAKSSKAYRPIEVLAGVQPDTDMTEASTQHWTFADKIRFRYGVPRKIGGWVKVVFSYSQSIFGIVRTIFSDIINGRYYTLAGTAYKLYYILGSTLVNITPFDDTSDAIPNSISTVYETLANNPVSTTNGSTSVRITTSSYNGLLEGGDIVTLSGLTTTNGVPNTELNADHIVRAAGIGYFDITVATEATSTGSGGGASGILTSGLIKISKTGHGMSNGDRVKITDAANTGGILAADINKEFIIRDVSTDYFYVMTDGTATSAVTGGGGSATEIYEEISAGLVDEQNVFGYGAGLYGVGLYGTGRESDTARALPRIWYMDRYADTIITTPGNQTPVYQWFGSSEEAPVIVANAPTEINYAFVSNNILVTFGAEGYENRIFASDINDIEEWTSSSVNQVYDDDIEGAGRLLSHVPVDEYNLIFTENQTYKFRYIGQPSIWEITELEASSGIISSMARVSVKGMAFWMGTKNFHMYRGGGVEIIPANSQGECTCIRYVYDNMNWGQKSKFFAWYNKEFDEIWFHYASANSNECDRVVVVNLGDFTWTLHSLERSAGEYPQVTQTVPRLADGSDIYQHETGHDADDEAMAWALTSNNRDNGKDNIKLMSVIPDSVQTGNISLRVLGKKFPQSQSAIYDTTYTVSPTIERVPTAVSARFIQYEFSGEELDQNFIMGKWLEEIQGGPTE